MMMFDTGTRHKKAQATGMTNGWAIRFVDTAMQGQRCRQAVPSKQESATAMPYAAWKGMNEPAEPHAPWF